MDGLRYSPDDPYYRPGPVHTCLYVRVRETGDWDLFPGPLEWARAENGGETDVCYRRFPGVTRVNEVTPVSLGYPLSVLNKKSTLKQTNKQHARVAVFGTAPDPGISSWTNKTQVPRMKLARQVAAGAIVKWHTTPVQRPVYHTVRNKLKVPVRSQEKAQKTRNNSNVGSHHFHLWGLV